MPVEHLQPQQVEQLRATLEAELVKVDAQVRAAQGEAAAAQMKMERQDAAAQETGRLNAVARSERAERYLDEIQAALQRFRDGSYGVCEESDEEIPFARLVAQPTTRYTVEALEQLGLDEGERNRGGDSDREAY